MKLAAKRAREQETEMATEQAATGEENTMKCQENPLPVTPSPKKNKLGKRKIISLVSPIIVVIAVFYVMYVARTPKVNSSGRQRRRSQRLLARSVFSPIVSTRSPNVCVDEIPTGCLISLT